MTYVQCLVFGALARVKWSVSGQIKISGLFLLRQWKRRTEAGHPSVFNLYDIRLQHLPTQHFTTTVQLWSLISSIEFKRYLSLSQSFWAHCCPLSGLVSPILHWCLLLWHYFLLLSLQSSVSVPLPLLLQRMGLSVLPHSHRSVPLWKNRKGSGSQLLMLVMAAHRVGLKVETDLIW